MTQPSETLDRNHVARIDTKPTNTIEGGDTCAEKRCILSCIDVWRNPDCSFGAKGTIFGNWLSQEMLVSVSQLHNLRHTSTVLGHTVDEFIITHLKQASVTTSTCPIVAAMP
jgi:hypothetical protein